MFIGRAKEIKTIEFEKLNLPEPTSRVEMVSLTPVMEKRCPKEITGTTQTIAEQLFTILKDDVRVL